MNKPEINQEVYEQYLDATVALFMEHYSAMLTEKVSSEGKDGEVVFPEALDLKCKALIKKEASKQKRLTLWKHTKRTLKAAAVFAIAVLTTFSMLFVSVEAFRIRVVNFYIEHGDNYWTITGNQELHQETTISPSIHFNIDDPLNGLIPEEYNLTKISNADSQRITATYENSQKEKIYFLTLPHNSSLQVDIEDADFTKELKVLDFDAVLSIKNGITQISWCDTETETMYLISADNTPESEVVTLATKLAKLVSN